MRHRSLSRIMAFLVLLTFAISSGARASWFCEGKQCSASIFFCCCLAPSGAQDTRCETTVFQLVNENVACDSGCRCEMRVLDVREGRTARPIQAPQVHFFAVLLTAAPCVLEGTAEPAASPRETRDPLPADASFPLVGLRAPPAA